MKILARKGTFDFIHVLIEKAGEYEAYINQLAKELKDWKLKDLSHDQLMKYHRIKGSRYIPQQDFPFIITVEVDYAHEILVVNHVLLSDFKADEETSNHLFEFVIRRNYRNSPYVVRESLYQVVAKDLFEAHTTLGRTFNKIDEYDLEVMSWKIIH